MSFGVDNTYSSVHIDGRNKNILVLGEGPTQRLDNATITAESKYPINFTESGKRFLLSLHYNGSNSFLFLNPNLHGRESNFTSLLVFP